MALVNVCQSPHSLLALDIAGNLDFYIELLVYFDLVINNGWSYWRLKIASICFLNVLFSSNKQAHFFFSLSVTRGPPAQAEMQSTSNHLWLLSDILGQGATANVFRGRHKVGAEKLWRLVIAVYVPFREAHLY